MAINGRFIGDSVELSPGYEFSEKKKTQNMCSYYTECVKS